MYKKEVIKKLHTFVEKNNFSDFLTRNWDFTGQYFTSVTIYLLSKSSLKIKFPTFPENYFIAFILVFNL